jgi:hypothetical protein
MGKDCRARVLDGYTLGHMIKTLEDEFLAIEGGRGLAERLEMSVKMQDLSAIVDDYLTMYCAYENMCMEAFEIWRAKENVETYLQEINGMRSWKLVQKYRKIMDAIKSGRLAKALLG